MAVVETTGGCAQRRLLGCVDDPHDAVGRRKAGVHGRIGDDAADEVLDFGDERFRVAGADPATGHGRDIGEVRMLWSGDDASSPRQRGRTAVGVHVELACGNGIEPRVTA